MRVLVNIATNVLIFAAEVAMIAAIAALGRYYPLLFAAATAAAAFALGLILERARLRHEMPFYFGRGFTGRLIGIELVAVFTSAFKGLIAGLVAVMTFSGTAPERLDWIAVVFGVCIFAGSSLLRRLTISFDASAPRWGFFRLGAPLGLLYAQVLALLVVLGRLEKPDVFGTLKHFVINWPEKPNLAQTGEFLFKIEQIYDDLARRLVSVALPEDWAIFFSALISVKVLSGFVIAIYAVLISEVVRVMEEGAAHGR